MAKARSGLSWKTVKHIRTAFGTILEEATRQDLLLSNPVRKTRLARRGPVPEKAAIAPDTLRVLIEKLAEASRTIAAAIAMTGLRIGELLALRWPDVDLQSGFLSVRQTVYEGHFDEPKTKRSKRTVPLPSECVGILARLRPIDAQPSALIFSTAKGSPLCRRNLLNRQFKPICKSLGLTGVTWHWLRHANATLHDARGTSLAPSRHYLGTRLPRSR